MINLTTEEQNLKYASGLQEDLKDFFRLLESDILKYLNSNKNATPDDIQNYINELFNDKVVI